MVYQSSITDCGKACVRNVLSLAFKSKDFSYQHLSSDCINFEEMREELLRNNLEYKSYEVFDVHLLKKEMLPAIAQIKNGEKTHFVVIKKITKKKIYILDPQFGYLILKDKEFKEVFLNNVLVLNKIISKTKAKKCDLLKPSEKLSYYLCGLFECVSLFFIFFSSGLSSPVVIMIIALTVFMVLLLLQNSINFTIKKRLENEIMIPYIKEFKDKDDFAILMNVFKLQIEKYSKSVSYFVALFMIFILMILNSYILSTVILISLSFNLLRANFMYERNYVNRKSSLYENEMFKDFPKNEFDITCFNKAKFLSQKFLVRYLFSYLAEYLFLLSVIIVELYFTDEFDINKIMYIFGLSITFSITTNSLINNLKIEERIIKEINSLSLPLNFFLLNNKFNLKYISNLESKELNLDERKIDTRIHKSGQSSDGS